MSESNELGHWGERQACKLLIEEGYSLLDANWAGEGFELDIVAEYFGEIVFVEVKTRRDDTYRQRGDALKPRKMRNLLLGGKAYMAAHHLDAPCRYDLITIIGTPEVYKIEHLTHAFSEESLYEHHIRFFKHEFEV